MAEQLLTLMDLNLAESNREQSRFLSPCRAVEEADVLYTASGTRCPGGPFNSVVGLGRTCPDPEQTLKYARTFYGELGRGFTVYVRTHVDHDLGTMCERAGFTKMSDTPGMVLRSRLPRPELGSSVAIREVEDAAGAPAFAEVAAASYESIGLPADITRKVFSMPARWLKPHLPVFVVFDHDEPVAAAMLHLSHGIAGVYWVGTVPAARGKGHANAVMRHVSNHAFDRGAAAVILQATPFGEPVYRKLGYQEVTRYPWYMAGKK
ncbi:MAG TPA: GNAT family N-acetyltransferase [Polyangiaceae bacterium]|nr:GNAT family N-acetyltransferase [Polyangiaceae bacterium]